MLIEQFWVQNVTMSFLYPKGGIHHSDHPEITRGLVTSRKQSMVYGLSS